MSTNFEPIYQALFDRIKTAPGIKTSSRRLQHWSDTPEKQQPALFVAQAGETPTQARGLPTKWSLGVDIYIYVTAPNEKIAPSTLLNPILAAIRDALAPSAGVDALNRVQTLGGLVSHAWISGAIEVYDGVLGNQTVAMIPIEILTA